MKNIKQFNKGIEWAEERLVANLKSFGTEKTKEYALSTVITTSDYAYDAKVKKDKKGKPLTQDRRNFFEGVYMVFKDFVDKRK